MNVTDEHRSMAKEAFSTMNPNCRYTRIEHEEIISKALAKIEQATIERCAEIAQSHCSLSKRKELIERYPAGDFAMSMAAYVAKAIRALSTKGE